MPARRGAVDFVRSAPAGGRSGVLRRSVGRADGVQMNDFHHGAPAWRYFSAVAAALFLAFGAAGLLLAAFFAGALFALGRDAGALVARAFAGAALLRVLFFADVLRVVFFMSRPLNERFRARNSNDPARAHFTMRFSSKIGSRIASTMKSTTPPMNTMMIGSRIVVSATTAFSTSSS